MCIFLGQRAVNTVCEDYPDTEAVKVVHKRRNDEVAPKL